MLDEAIRPTDYEDRDALETEAKMAEAGARVTVITGGASGIGHAAARKFASAGDLAVIADLSEGSGLEVVKEIEAAGGRAAFRKLDVADAGAVRAAAEAIEAQHGPVDVLINSAGILQSATPLERFEDDEHDRIWQVNYRGTYLCCRYFGVRMARRRSGAIVNIASTSGIMHLPMLAYGPGKAAVISLTGSLGVELGRQGVRVNAVAPGPVLTPIQQRNIQAGTRDPRLMAAGTAMNRWVKPEEIADGLYFLASPAASANTGVTLPIDCGLLPGVGWAMVGGIPRE
jgi:NAD(P)-dependent dehydrogenase (short-subunit alcohol dehydrogenase family)